MPLGQGTLALVTGAALEDAAHPLELDRAAEVARNGREPVEDAVEVLGDEALGVVPTR